jgi:Mg-chelatase subunit ChlD
MHLMRTVILILLAAFALGAAASAAYPVELRVTGSQPWMVADGKDYVTITATVTAGTGEHAGDPLEGANVSFAVGSPWQLKDSFLLTDKKGVATTILFPTKVSGNASVTVNAWAMIETETWGYLNYSSVKVLEQPIDHGTPSSLVTSFKSQVQVRTPVRISALMKDAFGNPVDNRNVVEKVQFDAPSKGVSGFLSGSSWVKSLTVPVNDSGYAEVQYLVDPVGTNSLVITPPNPLKQRILSIEGISQGVPFRATSIVSPPGSPYPYTTVKSGTFVIGFTFYDQYGFPTMNQPVNITTSVPGEAMNFVTNKNGMVVISYGPKDIAGIYAITAKAFNNQSASVSRQVEFVSGEPVDALLTASPQTMASRDVKNDITSVITMRVMDSKGNPVQGESVSFRFSSIIVDKKLNQTAAPVLENGAASTSATGVDIPAVSDENGNAMVTFHPGAFSTDYTVKDYNSSATGKAVIEARWSKVTRQATLGYLNYPYLTIQSWVSPTMIRVNDTVDVTVKITGDGWALQPKPIDVMLVSDRSGSMLTDYPDRAVSVIGASKVFSSQLDYTRDRVGLVSFGGKGKPDVSGESSCGLDGDDSDDWAYATANYPGNGRTYGDNATLDLALSTSSKKVSDEIPRLVPGGYTSMRYALKTAIDQMIANNRDNAVKAVVILSDGDYNWYGDPLARKNAGSNDPSSYGDLDSKHLKFASITNNTQQNMAEYAKANNIRIYTIGFAQGISSGGQTTLKLLASQTGGTYYYAPTGNDLNKIYTDIAGSLKDTAGVNTVMNLSFNNIVVNNVSVPGDQVYGYTFIPGRSTLVDTWNVSGRLAGYPMTANSTPDWNRDRSINFFIGTIRLGQTWQSTVTLRILKDGNINVFDPASKITMQDSLFPLRIPDVYITALPNSSPVALTSAARLQLDSLAVTNPGGKTNADLRWNLAYDGVLPVSEDVMIASYGTENWIKLPRQWASNATSSDIASVPIDALAYGYYTIRVEGYADDATLDADERIIALTSSGISMLAPGVTPVPGTPVPTKTPVPYIRLS